MTGRRAPILCMVTDRARYPDRALLPAIAAAAEGGVDLIQVRERDLPDRDLLALVRAAVEATAHTRAQIIVNDRTDVALAAGAAGVHLRGESVSCADVRRLVPPGFLVGRSVHAPEEAAAAAVGGHDYLVFGTVLPSASKDPGQPAAGFTGLAQVCRAVAGAGGGTVPVLAIGGLTAAHARDVARAGAAGIAAIGLFAGAPDMAGTVSTLRAEFDS